MTDRERAELEIEMLRRELVAVQSMNWDVPVGDRTPSPAAWCIRLERRLEAELRLATAALREEGPPVLDLVITDLLARNRLGVERYGRRLVPNNGRDALQDAYEEALDLCAYLRQLICERAGLLSDQREETKE